MCAQAWVMLEGAGGVWGGQQWRREGREYAVAEARPSWSVGY